MLDIAHVFLFTYYVSRVTPPCRQSLILLIISTVLSLWYRLEILKTSNVCYLETNCSISFKLTAFITDIHRCFLSN